ARLPNTHRDTLLACVYINTHSSDFDSNRHWTVLEECLESGLDTGRDLLVVGDFNAEHTELGGRHDTVPGRRLAAIKDNLDLVCINRIHCPNVITRPSPLLVLDRGGSTIDMAFCNSHSLITKMTVDSHADTSDSVTGLHSDHLPLLIDLRSARSESYQLALQPSAPRWGCREATEGDWGAYSALLETRLRHLQPTLENQLTLPHPPTDVIESAWAALRDVIVEVG